MADSEQTPETPPDASNSGESSRPPESTTPGEPAFPISPKPPAPPNDVASSDETNPSDETNQLEAFEGPTQDESRDVSSKQEQEPAAVGPLAPRIGDRRDEGHGDQQNADNAAQPHLPEIPGPGLPEALFWTVGVLIIHIIGLVVTIMALFAVHIGNGHPFDAKAFSKRLSGPDAPWLFAGELSMFVIGAIGVAVLRLGPNYRRRLALTSIPFGHLTLIVCSFLPLAVLCGRLHSWAMDIWNQLTPLLPFLPNMDKFDAIEAIKPLADSSPLWALLLILAVAPAVGEELIFRGLIGRGLVARWGIPAGILITSFLFCIVHGHPAHAFALIPLAVFMHVIYLATRSFWAPVLLHFLNNALAAVMLKHSQNLNIEAMGDDANVPLLVAVTAAICSLIMGILIWRTRAEYRLPDGTVWDPGYSTAEQPPPRLAAEKRCRRASGWLVGLAIASFLVFLASGAVVSVKV